MFERFTDRARKVMTLANQEAQRLSHEYIGTEHILLGLVKEGSGVGAAVLKNLDIDLKKVRVEVEKLVESGPEMIMMGKLPQTPQAKRVIEFGIEEARNLKHNYVGTEHLLLGLCRDPDTLSFQVLTTLLNVSLEDLREEVVNFLGATEEGISDGARAAARGGAAPKHESSQELLRDLRDFLAKYGDVQPIQSGNLVNRIERLLDSSGSWGKGAVCGDLPSG